MKIPLNWLKEYVKIDISQEELVTRLTAIGHMQDKKPENIAGDIVLDLEVRQNRSDCLSILGIAQEVGAITRTQITKPTTKIFDIPKDSAKLKIVNHSPKNCIRFKAFKISNVNPLVQTPKWMSDRLMAYGMKSLGAIIDITNYVMIETGEPMHAFDSKSIPNGLLNIRQAKNDEKMTILGDKTISLVEDDLVISDESDSIVSFSGLIGGEGSGIKSDSIEVILEAATYNQSVIRRSSIRHSIRTEASTRHEKFLHPQIVDYALNRALTLILDICGGEIVVTDDNYNIPEKERVLKLTLSEVSRLGGIKISIDEVSKFLTDLNFEIKSQSEPEIEVVVPVERTDIIEEVDLVEEVLRLYGYENIPSVYPALPPSKNITSQFFELEENIRDHLLSLGFSEEITVPLVSESDTDTRTAVKLQNALNSEKSSLRTDMKIGLQNAYVNKKKYGLDNIKIFEIGKVYSKSKNPKFLETRKVALLIHDKNLDQGKILLNLKATISSLFDNALFQKVPANSEIMALDDHTVYVEYEIKIPSSLEKKSDIFYKSIPHYSEIDISIAIVDSADLSEIANSLSSNDNHIENITWETNSELAPKGEIFVLFKIRYMNLEITKDDLITKINDLLVHKYEARIR